MELPKIRNIREVDVKVGKNTFKIKPWSNRDALRYESSIDVNDLTEDHKKQMIYQHLVKPNLINYEKDLTPIEREVVYIEMYKISKGVIIPLKYKCPKEECGHVSEINFNITKNYVFHEMKSHEIQTKDIKFKLKSSTYVPAEGDENIMFFASFIREFEYKGEKYVSDLNDLVDWLLDDLDEENLTQFIDKMIENLPYIEMTLDCECELCGNKETFNFKELPDF